MPLQHSQGGKSSAVLRTRTSGLGLRILSLARQNELAPKLDVVRRTADENCEVTRLSAPGFLFDVVEGEGPTVKRKSHAPGLPGFEIYLCERLQLLDWAWHTSVRVTNIQFSDSSAGATGAEGWITV